MDELKEEKSIRTIPFSGKKHEYIIWRARFLSFAQIRGCKQILLGKTKVPDASMTLVKGTDDPEILSRHSNAVAYSMLNMAVSDSVSFGAVYNAQTKELPDGDAAKALANLDKIYKSKSSAKKNELEQNFNDCKLLKEEKSPDEYFADLDKIRLQLQIDYDLKTYDDEKVKSHILYNVKPRIYDTVIHVIKRDIDMGTTITLENLKEDLRRVYAQRHSEYKERDRGHREESVLYANTNPGKFGNGKFKFKKVFKGDCRICGKKGHKAADCWEQDKNKERRPVNYKLKNEAAYLMTDQKKKCTYCGKENHTVEQCFKKQRDEKKPAGQNREIAEMVIMAAEDISEDVSKNIFIADSGATSHMRNSTQGMYELKDYVVDVRVGNSSKMQSLKKGKFQGMVTQKDGTTSSIIMQDVLYVPDLWVNLLSITKAISCPNVHLAGKENIISLQTGQDVLTFDHKLTNGSGTGWLWGVQIIPIDMETGEEIAYVSLESQSYSYVHGILGHPNERVTKATAKKLGIRIKDSPHTICIDCATSKAKRKNISRSTTTHATEKGERLAIDISSVRAKSYGGSKYWLMIQDEYSGYVWSRFLKKKSELPQEMFKLIHFIQKLFNITIKNIRCDNSKENESFKEMMDETKGVNINFEFIAPYTPEMNGKIERKFATLYGKARSMLNAARLPHNLRVGLWAQCAKIASQLENIIVSKEDELSPAEKMYGENPRWSKQLRTFGEVAILNDDEHKIKGKLRDRGFPAIFVSYPDHQPSDVYEFMKLSTRAIVKSRNICWLNQSYGTYKKITQVNVLKPMDEDDEEDIQAMDIFESGRMEEVANEENDVVIISEDDMSREGESASHTDDSESQTDDSQESEETEDSSEEERAAPPNVGVRLNTSIRHLTTSYNPDPLKTHMEDTAEVAVISDEQFAFTAGFTDGSNDPVNYKQVKNHPDKGEWWKAMCTEFQNIEKKRVWEIVEKSRVPSNRQIIGNRWVYAKKDDGRFRARSVAKGYSQIPGKDFQENHAPVVNDTTFHLTLCWKVMYKLMAGQFDIETAFLYGDLDEEIWMEFPDGYEDYLLEMHQTQADPNTQCVKLNKALYGLVQAARQWWKKFKEIMLSLNFQPSEADPCLFIKKNPKNEIISFVILYVDDGGIIGTQETIDELISGLSEDFKVKYLGPMEYFVGCRLVENQEKDTLWIHQPKLIKNLKLNFGQLVESVKFYKTPAMPRTVILRPTAEETMLSAEDQKKYRSGVGMLLYLVKHSRPDIANAVRELSKVADGATKDHWKALLRVIKYVLSTEYHGLKIKPSLKESFYMEGISDSEYAGDKDSRISVFGYILYFCGAPIAWKSKAGKSVTLSSTEAEYVAASEIAKEAIFVKNILDSVGIKIELPITIRVDNVGAIYLANNYATSQRTKHIDIRAHFLREYIESGVLKVVFIRSEDNDADILTKNTPDELFHLHAKKNVEEIKELVEENKENTNAQ